MQRYDNPTKFPRALVPFVCCRLYVRVSARTVWRSRRRYCRKAASDHTVMSLHYANTCTPTRRNVDHWAGFVEKPTEKPTEKCWVSVSVFSFSFSKPTKLTDFFVRNRKTDQAISTFGSQPCVQNPGLAAFAQSSLSLLVYKIL